MAGGDEEEEEGGITSHRARHENTLRGPSSPALTASCSVGLAGRA